MGVLYHTVDGKPLAHVADHDTDFEWHLRDQKIPFVKKVDLPHPLVQTFPMNTAHVRREHRLKDDGTVEEVHLIHYHDGRKQKIGKAPAHLQAAPANVAPKPVLEPSHLIEQEWSTIGTPIPTHAAGAFGEPAAADPLAAQRERIAHLKAQLAARMAEKEAALKAQLATPPAPSADEQALAAQESDLQAQIKEADAGA